MYSYSYAYRLEVFNSVILHHLAENPNLIYGILSAHKTFEDLGTFTLTRGLREIRRVQTAKEEQARKADTKGRANRNPGDDQEPHEEKAKLLQSESDNALDLAESGEIQRSPRQSGTQDEQPAISDPASSAEPPLSPASETTPPITGPPSAISEKARGKMRARRSQSLDTNSSQDHIVATGVGRNGFIPTQEWV